MSKHRKVAASVTVLLIAYFAGAFITWRIDPSEWESSARFAVCLFGLWGAGMTYLCTGERR